MAYTQQDLDRLQAALANPAEEILFQGRKTKFRTVAELERAITTVENGLAAQSGAAPIRTIKTFMDDENDATL